MYESRLIGETQPVNSVEVSFCTVPCHAEACPADATCRKILSLKTSCTKDSECTTNSPWAVCETPRFCETSRKECESAADCTGEACLPDDAAARFCTYKFCIPEKYAPGT
jgi:hypothetical protein